MTGHIKEQPGSLLPPEIGSMVDVPLLQSSSPYQDNGYKAWPDGTRGQVVELMMDDPNDPNDPHVCLEIDGEDGVLFGWFLLSVIRAGRIEDEEYFLSVDCMISDKRPSRTGDDRILFFFPETNEWLFGDRWKGPTG